jgi:N utilization substance protein A
MPQAQTAELNLNEILRQVAREKDIDLERWISALEDAMASAAKKQHRIKEPVRAHLDRETGKFDAFIVKKVVETVEDPLAEWTVEEARDHKAQAEVGDEIHLPISTDGLGRIAAQNAKQVLYQRVREAERENIYNEYIDRVGEILNGTVKRFERGDVIVDLGRTEAVVPRSEQARHERYSQGERIRAVIVDVHKQPKGPQIVLSRTDPRLGLGAVHVGHEVAQHRLGVAAARQRLLHEPCAVLFAAGCGRVPVGLALLGPVQPALAVQVVHRAHHRGVGDRPLAG